LGVRRNGQYDTDGFRFASAPVANDGTSYVAGPVARPLVLRGRTARFPFLAVMRSIVWRRYRPAFPIRGDLARGTGRRWVDRGTDHPLCMRDD